MSDSTTDPTLDRLLRHMAWANAALIGQLAGLTDEALGLASPRNEWTVAMILRHLVDAAERYAARLEGMPRPDATEPPAAVAELTELAARCAAIDARIRAQAAVPDGPSPPRTPERSVGRDRPSSARRSTTPPNIGPRSREPSPPTGSTRSTSMPSTCGPTATLRASARSPNCRPAVAQSAVGTGPLAV